MRLACASKIELPEIARLYTYHLLSKRAARERSESSVLLDLCQHLLISTCSMSDKMQVCAVCKIPAMQLCAGCKSVYYCNREHQKKHWKEGHKNNCASYKIAANSTGAQHLIAARDIKQNEVILKEIPVVVAPHDLTFVTCLGCNRRIHDKPDSVYRCPICNWPLCGPNCQTTPLHRDECKLMADRQFKADFEPSAIDKTEAYTVIPPLRTLLLKSAAKTKFDTLIALLSRPEVIKAYDEKRDKLRTNVIPFLQEVLKLEYSEDEIVQACSIFGSNCFEVVREDGDINIRGLFPMASLLKHDCVPNTKHSFHGDNCQMTLIATVPIAKGELITTSYTETLWGTLGRRTHLKESKYIDCTCKRCSDKTELGSYLGAIFCSRCKKPNEESCPKILSTDPLNPAAIWKCEKCDHTIRGRQMVWGNDALKSEMNRLGKNPLHLEQFLAKYKEALHVKNYHSLIAKYALSQIYGNTKGYLLTDLTDEIIERKLDVCHELLEVLDVLAPGFTTIRGSLLYELQSVMVIQAKRELNTSKITKAAAQDTLTECMVILKEATDILSSEPDMKEFLQEKLQLLAKELNF